jgi:starch synthase (maltosyl-transferring)
MVVNSWPAGMRDVMLATMASPRIPESPPSSPRVVIESVRPEIDGGRFPIKRVVGERVVVEADIFADGHDVLAGVIRHRPEGVRSWSESPLEFLVNDHWRGEFRVTREGLHFYTLEAWIDPFAGWRRDLALKAEAGQDVTVDLAAGAGLVAEAARRAAGANRELLTAAAARLREAAADAVAYAADAELAALMTQHVDRSRPAVYEKTLLVVVDRLRARFSTWYELFPRSRWVGEKGEGPATLRDCAARVPQIAAMGFDVLYLPPVHPIGHTFRKGRNGALEAKPEDPGSPWAIGAAEGGHKAIDPALGTMDDFRALVRAAANHDMEVALDIAFQCSPDHPYLKEHPEWFRRRPDGTVQYAENPPKKYQDIYPFDFASAASSALQEELRSIFTFWIGQGVRIFRVDNPHTKPFSFWEWLIPSIKREHSDVLFLAEAFSRPRLMYRLAKLGFTQSYTYFAWRNARWELAEYMRELTTPPVCEYFRANFWPNTPDILTEYLQLGGRPAFMTRVILAATLTASYGIYGPAFELCVNAPREPGSEEYLDSEKYEVKHWNVKQPGNLRDFIARLNRIRRGNPALQTNEGFHAHGTDNEQLFAYSKSGGSGENLILAVVNLDPHHTHAGWTDLDLPALELDEETPFQVHDLLTDARYLWRGPRNFVQLDPQQCPAHLFRIRRRARTEKDFEYFA